MIADEQQIFRFDVEVLQAVPFVDEVEHFGGVPQVNQQLFARDSFEALLAAVVETRFEAALRQFGDDNQPAGEDFDPLDRQQKRMTHLSNAVERFQLALGALCRARRR